MNYLIIFKLKYTHYFDRTFFIFNILFCFQIILFFSMKRINKDFLFIFLHIKKKTKKMMNNIVQIKKNYISIYSFNFSHT